jgi:outer membrane autotransporter protein
VAGAEWHYRLDSLVSRMGEMRRELDGMPKDRFNNVWARTNVYKLNAGESFCTAAFDQEVYNFTFGIDAGRRVSGSSMMVAGVFGDMGYVDRTFDNRGTGATNSFGTGIYLTWLKKNGWYADAVFKYDRNSNRINARASNGFITRGDYENDIFGFSFEAGRKIGLGGQWWIEPSVQAAFAGLEGCEYETDNGILVKINRAGASQYRAQARIGYDRARDGRLQPYGRLAYVICEGSDGTITADGDTLSGRVDLSDRRFETGLGAAWLINKRNQLYMEYEYAQANHYKRPWGFNFGFRHVW